MLYYQEQIVFPTKLYLECIDYVTTNNIINSDIHNGSMFNQTNQRRPGFHSGYSSLERRKWFLSQASAEIQAENEVVLEIVSTTDYPRTALQFASAELQADRAVVLAAVKSNGTALQAASAELQKDPDIVAAAIASNFHALDYAAPELKNCKQFLFSVLPLSGSLRYVPVKLKGDKDLFRAALSKTSFTMELADHASPDLLADQEFMLEIIRASHWEAIFYVAPGLRNDQEVAVEAVRQNKDALRALPADMQGNPVVLAAAKKKLQEKSMLPYRGGTSAGTNDRQDRPLLIDYNFIYNCTRVTV